MQRRKERLNVPSFISNPSLITKKIFSEKQLFYMVANLTFIFPFVNWINKEDLWNSVVKKFWRF